MKAILKKVLPSSTLDWIKALLKIRKKVINKPVAISYHSDDSLVLRCYVSYNKFGGYCIPQSSHHRPAAQKILAGGIWEPDTIDFITRHAGNGDIVHAGTYFGDFIPALSRTCIESAKLWAFEPNPENYRCALITIAINHLNNVDIKKAGLGAQTGSLSMEITDEKGIGLGGASRLIEGQRNNRRQFTNVDILRLDDILPPERRITILQLDVEGFEQQALTGSMETIKRCKPIIILENLPESSWLAENILCMGYQVSGKLHENTILSVEVTT